MLRQSGRRRWSWEIAEVEEGGGRGGGHEGVATAAEEKAEQVEEGGDDGDAGEDGDQALVVRFDIEFGDEIWREVNPLETRIGSVGAGQGMVVQLQETAGVNGDDTSASLDGALEVSLVAVECRELGLGGGDHELA